MAPSVLPLEVTNVNLVLAIIGGWVIFFGTFSRLITDRLYLSIACESFRAILSLYSAS